MVPDTMTLTPQSPALPADRVEPADELAELEFVNVEDTVLSANKCNCAASDDNPY